MNPRKLDQLDRDILNAIQKDFPVESHPWATVAKQLDPKGKLTEDEIINRVKKLRQDGFIRRLGAVFNATSLGYNSTLCAAIVPPENIENFITIVNQAPQVTHNYLRSGELNVWFTFTTHHNKELTDLLTRLKEIGGAKEIHEFKSKKTFKINLAFHLTPPKKN